MHAIKSSSSIIGERYLDSEYRLFHCCKVCIHEVERLRPLLKETNPDQWYTTEYTVITTSDLLYRRDTVIKKKNTSASAWVTVSFITALQNLLHKQYTGGDIYHGLKQMSNWEGSYLGAGLKTWKGLGYNHSDGP